MIVSPVLVFVLSLVALWLSAQSGSYLRKQRGTEQPSEREDLTVTLTATFTLLGLVIGFTFSMAATRYDLRKSYEEEEANAIGTEFVRADLLPSADATKVRALLKSYLDQRILSYTTHDTQRLEQINASTAQLQTSLWSAVQGPAEARPTPVIALTVSGMNDVLNSQGYAQAASWNRIPIAAWALMGAIAIFANLLFGYYSRRPGPKLTHFVSLPLLVAISFFLIADMDSPRRGVIRVVPQNLISLSRSLSTQ
ncbi:MAG: hypothetical protein JO033_13230 [Acidobacteriaceae bacterium]|nr:hypothetical protein [Acidobacteriaceae bacterium]MBV9498787.1 hypothetical protein [Acidobacteriaceae bacterium]